MFRLRWLLAALLSVPLTVLGQDSLRTDRFFRVDSDNDLYQPRRAITDRYYTNGLRLTFQSNYWRRWPTRHVLPRFRPRPGRRYDLLYDFAVGQDTHTPRDIRRPRFSETPAFYDSPYAGYLFVAWGLTVSDGTGGRRLTTNISLGVLGPLSLAAEGQIGLHKLIDDPSPLGWEKQLRNSPAVSYHVRYEGRPIGRLFRELDVTGALEGNVGTMTNYLGTSLMVRLGRFNDYFQSATGLYESRFPRQKSDESMLAGHSAGQRRFQFYAFLRPALRAVLDNSLLQGGWLHRNRESYAVPFSQIKHGYAQLDIGGAIAYQGFQLAYTVSQRGREYDLGEQHRWARISAVWRW